MSTVSFVTGAGGLVGGALVDSLVADGHEVRVLVREPGAARALAERGARPVFGDLTEERGTWRPEVAGAEAVWHLGLPRIRTPLRGWRVARLRSEAALAARNLARSTDDGATVVMASTVLVWGSHPGADVREDDPPAPVGMGDVALAAERGLERLEARVVRLGWVYGPGGFAPGMLRAIRGRRYRLVGDGGNHVPVVSWTDAAAALRVAAGLGPGVYVAAEAAPPTQRELVEHLCAEMGVRRCDVLPPRMAAFSLGSGIARALCASCRAAPGALAAAGWSPRHDWRRDLIPSAEPGAGRGPAGGR